MKEALNTILNHLNNYITTLAEECTTLRAQLRGLELRGATGKYVEQRELAAKERELATKTVEHEEALVLFDELRVRRLELK